MESKGIRHQQGKLWPSNKGPEALSGNKGSTFIPQARALILKEADSRALTLEKKLQSQIDQALDRLLLKLL
jgi:hypothetical protein